MLSHLQLGMCAAALADPIMLDYATGKPRSPHWPALRNAIIAQQPWCSCCGSTQNLTVHHLRPFHLDAADELNPENLIVLCEGHPGRLAELNCHFVFGHLGNWQTFDPDAVEIVKRLRKLFDASNLAQRPELYCPRSKVA